MLPFISDPAFSECRSFPNFLFAHPVIPANSSSIPWEPTSQTCQRIKWARKSGRWNLQIFTITSFFPIQCPSLIPSSVDDHLLWLLQTLCLILRGLSRFWFNTPCSYFLWTSSVPLPSPSPFLSYSSVSRNTFYGEPPVAIPSRIPGELPTMQYTANTHSFEHERGKKLRNKAPTQHRQNPILSPRITIFTNLDEWMSA